MAIFRLECKILSRNQGKNVIAASAYRSGSKLESFQTHEVWDYEAKDHDLIHSEISMPDCAPEHFKQRELLWNHVEIVEKRKDAQLARELIITLPRELTPDQNIALARAYIDQEFISRGMIADWNVHRGHKNKEEQPHVHVMLSLREVTPDGFGKKVREWNDRPLMTLWRERWADVCNLHLAKHGYDVRIDHRSLAEQGIALTPQTKIGHKAQREHLDRYHHHQRIAFENGQKILNDPTIALYAITRQQSTSADA